MSRKPYRTIADVLASPWASVSPTPQKDWSDRVLRSTKLEDSIYKDLRTDDFALVEVEQTAGEKLKSFPALSRDIFQSFYSLAPRREERELSPTAEKFNAPLLEQMCQSEDYPTLKSICEGRELPAYEAASEFISRIAEDLDGLLSDLSGNPGAMNTLEKLETDQAKVQDELAELLDRMRHQQEPNEALQQRIINAANNADSKQRQVEAVRKMIDASAIKNKEQIETVISAAVSSAAEKAEEVQSIIGAWSDDPGNLERNAVNADLLELVRQSKALRDISKYLGRFREIFAQGKRNGYAYGRGETYALELGNNLTRAIPSELALLAVPETIPLFLQKCQRKQLKQYQRREPIYKGMGDMICCLDESSSTKGDPAAWGKAVALTLLEIAAEHDRKLALIHFSGTEQIRTDLFLPGEYGMADKLRAAEVFLNGGTDFETPMREAIRLMDEEGFEQADIVFITDGQCELPDQYLQSLQTEQSARQFAITGVLLDTDNPGMDFSLKSFCQNIYRTSELMGDEIVQKLVSTRI